MAKIKSKSEPWNEYHNGNEIEEYLKEHILTDNHIIDDDDEIYVKKSNGHVHPLSHPDLSTQPSILHERFGTYRIYEVLIPVFGDELTSLSYNQIPDSAVIISVFAFNDDMQSSVTTKRVSDGWEVNVVGGFVPEFLLVKYYEPEKNKYGSDEYYNTERANLAYWRYNDFGDRYYMVNRYGNLMRFNIQGLYYIVCTNYTDEQIPNILDASSFISVLEDEWGVENIEYTSGDTSYFVFSIVDRSFITYAISNGRYISPSLTSY